MADIDQSVALSDSELTLLDYVSEIVTKSVTAGDPVPAFGFGKELVRSGQIRGLALAKLLYEMKSKWSIFQAAGIEDNFEDVAFEHVGRSPETILKYTRMWESIFANPEVSEDDKKRLMGKDIKELLLLPAIIREGVDKETMDKLLNASDRDSLRDIIKGERGDRTSSSNAIRIFLQRTENRTYPEGTIFARSGGHTSVIGSLDVNGATGDETGMAEKAIARIVGAAGIVEV